MPSTYLDFDLAIRRGDDQTYRAAVVSSPAGETRASLSLPFTETGLWIQINQFHIAAENPVGSGASAGQSAVSKLGSSLFDARKGEYLCLSVNSPVVRYPELPQPIKALRVKPPCVSWA